MFRTFLTILLLLMSGCSLTNFSGGESKSVKLSDLRAVQPNLKTIKKEIKRSEIQAALDRVGENNIRIVQVHFGPNSGNVELPQYRLFDISERGIYNLIGLRTADILVAASDYVVFEPNQFRAFVQLLKGMNEATIEIRRAKVPTLIDLKIVD